MAQSLDETAVDVVDPADSATVADTTQAETQLQDSREPEDVEMYPDDPPKDGEEAPADEGEDDTNVNDDLPEIKAPHSWKAEEKEVFAKLPRELQEAVSRRQTEVDRFAESKAREAQTARQAAEREAIAQVQKIAAQHAQAFEEVLPPIVPRPSNQLQVDNPIAYADQMDAHEESIAQYHAVQHRIDQARQQAGYAEHLLRVQAQQDFHNTLAEKFPEFIEQNEAGAKLREQLGSIALELGYPGEALNDVDANDVLAMRKVNDWKVKADRYDALQKDKMAAVRSAKGLPKFARPGAAAPAGSNARSDDPAKLLYPND